MLASFPTSLAERICEAPFVSDIARAERELEALAAVAVGDPELRDLAALLSAGGVRDLLAGLFSASPYLTRLIVRHPLHLQRCLLLSPEGAALVFADELRASAEAAVATPDVMRALRIYKAQLALLTALADLGGVWAVMTVTHTLATAADTATQVALAHLFREAQRRGDWLDGEPAAEMRSGYFVLAMGKHGAFELNYSSDIDLIVFYEPAKVCLSPTRDVQTFFVRMTRDLVKLMQEPTEHGYVFRTDLRLRPDPGSTPVALSTSAAANYYESVGQNWERAALIKARVIAGDRAEGEAFLSEIAPFIWRKHLDFAAIADIHAMKRQIHAVKGFGTIAVAGHNIKVGRGGIREIEFFAQTQQLIAGGRQRDLRVADTLTALDRLVQRQWIARDVRDDLAEAYCFLRRVEHRLQMIADEQTQTLPVTMAELATLAAFCGYATFAEFSVALIRRLQTVQHHYGALFEASPALTATGRDMVFAGATDDPATIAALSLMGFSAPASVVECVRGWHHGRVRSVRSARARELLTEVQPRLIEALAATANPDQAFAGFDRFLADLPSGVQLFSLLKQHPALLSLVAEIMGTAPRLAAVLSSRARVLDAVLDPGFFGTVASPDVTGSIIAAEVTNAAALEEILDVSRRVGREQAFLIGVRVLTATIDAAEAGRAYASLADELIKVLVAFVAREIERSHGLVPGGAVAVVAMGKLGGREMTASSDLDLIVIYDFDAAATLSSGQRPISPPQYFTRLTQRLIAAFTAPTAEGSLYEVDMRLRPSGQQGPVATQLQSFIAYQANDAWTWEHMALSRARIVAGPDQLVEKIQNAITGVLCRPRERARISADVREMRQRIVDVKGSADPWNLKNVRGGLVDIEFIAQFLQLVHAATFPQILDTSTSGALRKLLEAGILAPAPATALLSAVKRLNCLTQVLRLSLIDDFDPATAHDGLKQMLARVGDAPTFDVLTADLRVQHVSVAALFDALVV